MNHTKNDTCSKRSTCYQRGQSIQIKTMQINPPARKQDIAYNCQSVWADRRSRGPALQFCTLIFRIFPDALPWTDHQIAVGVLEMCVNRPRATNFYHKKWRKTLLLPTLPLTPFQVVAIIYCSTLSSRNCFPPRRRFDHREISARPWNENKNYHFTERICPACLLTQQGVRVLEKNLKSGNTVEAPNSTGFCFLSLDLWETLNFKTWMDFTR